MSEAKSSDTMSRLDLEPDARLVVQGLGKSFRMHLRGGITLPVFRDVAFSLKAGDVAVLGGPSGIGKSSILKMLYGNYAVDEGEILVRHQGVVIDLAKAEPRQVIEVRQETIGYVSQFLRTVPRVSARDIVADPLAAHGVAQDEARARAETLLARLNLPKSLWDLPPATFSGGEQQRVNIAHGFITDHPVLLLDEPTASLDAENRRVVVDMIREKQAAGVALLGIFHDEEVRDTLTANIIDMTRFSCVPAKEGAAA